MKVKDTYSLRAARLRAALQEEFKVPVKLSTAYEIMAKEENFPTWDAASEVLRRNPSKGVPVTHFAIPSVVPNNPFKRDGGWGLRVYFCKSPEDDARVAEAFSEFMVDHRVTTYSQVGKGPSPAADAGFRSIEFSALKSLLEASELSYWLRADVLVPVLVHDVSSEEEFWALAELAGRGIAVFVSMKLAESQAQWLQRIPRAAIPYVETYSISAQTGQWMKALWTPQLISDDVSHHAGKEKREYWFAPSNSENADLWLNSGQPASSSDQADSSLKNEEPYEKGRLVEDSLLQAGLLPSTLDVKRPGIPSRGFGVQGRAIVVFGGVGTGKTTAIHKMAESAVKGNRHASIIHVGLQEQPYSPNVDVTVYDDTREAAEELRHRDPANTIFVIAELRDSGYVDLLERALIDGFGVLTTLHQSGALKLARSRIRMLKPDASLVDEYFLIAAKRTAPKGFIFSKAIDVAPAGDVNDAIAQILKQSSQGSLPENVLNRVSGPAISPPELLQLNLHEARGPVGFVGPTAAGKTVAMNAVIEQMVASSAEPVRVLCLGTLERSVPKGAIVVQAHSMDDLMDQVQMGSHVDEKHRALIVITEIRDQLDFSDFKELVTRGERILFTRFSFEHDHLLDAISSLPGAVIVDVHRKVMPGRKWKHTYSVRPSFGQGTGI